MVQITSAWCQTLHFHPTNGWSKIPHWTQAALSNMSLLGTADQPGPCWPKSRESSACRKHWTSARTKIHPRPTPAHLAVPCSCWLFQNASLVAVRPVEARPPQWWPCPLATLCNPGTNLKPTFWVSEGFVFFQNKSQHRPWIKYSKLFYHAALQKSPQVHL